MPARFETAGGGLVSAPPPNQPFLIFFVELPDTFAGQNLTFGGQISPPLASGGLSAAVPLSGTVTLPGVPGGGLSLNWIIEVNTATGVCQAKAGTAATTGTQVTPTPDANNIAIFTHTITNADTIPWVRNPIMADLNP